jgi:hypothetical protein
MGRERKGGKRAGEEEDGEEGSIGERSGERGTERCTLRQNTNEETLLTARVAFESAMQGKGRL